MEKNKSETMKTVDYKVFIKRLWEFKFWYISIGFIFLFIATIINKYKAPQFENSTTILIKEDEQSSFLNSATFNLSSGLFDSESNIENELELLRSFSLIKKTVERLNLKTSFYSFEDKMVKNFLYKIGFEVPNSLYNYTPLNINVNTSHDQLLHVDYFVEIVDENTYRLKVNNKEDGALFNYLEERYTHSPGEISYNEVHVFGEEVITDWFAFTIVKNANFTPDFTKGQKLFFRQNNPNYLALICQANLSVETTSPTSTLLNVTFKADNSSKVTDFLNELALSYLSDDIDKKGKEALSTINFIDTQIADISDSLSYAEANLKQFRTSNNVLDLSFQGQQIFEKLDELEKEKAAFTAQKRYYNYLLDYFNKNSDVGDLTAPSSMNVVDPILTGLITKLLDLDAQRSALLSGKAASNNLYLNDIQPQIENLKNTIVENVKNNLNNVDISLNEIDYRITKLDNQISDMPKTELQLLGIERKFKLNDAIYTFLLQKRSEAQIARASNTPDYEIIESAQYALAHQVAPNKKLNYIIALLLTLVLPTVSILGYDFFDNKLSERDTISSLVDVPILGNTYHNRTGASKVMIEAPQSPVAESFRAIRTSFNFFKKDNRKQVISFTSSFSGEGKTFNAINTALSFALNGDKTVLLEFDLRRPKIHQEFGLKNELGITSFLVGDVLLNDIVKQSLTPNLDIITSGPLPPNPAELIASKQTKEMFYSLQEMYDYIIIDSAPVGVISDTFLLMEMSDINIFIVRQNKTDKDAMFNTLNKIRNNNIDNLAILVNDVDAQKQSSKYGYDAKYYTKTEEKTFVDKIIKKIKKS